MPGLNDALSATLPADPTDDWSGVSAIDLPGEATWPMSLVSFFYVNQNLRDQIGELSRADDASGNLLKAFLEYVLSDAGQALLSEYSFVPLSGASLAKARVRRYSVRECMGLAFPSERECLRVCGRVCAPHRSERWCDRDDLPVSLPSSFRKPST